MAKKRSIIKVSSTNSPSYKRTTGSMTTNLVTLMTLKVRKYMKSHKAANQATSYRMTLIHQL